MPLYGYARVSTIDQDLRLQRSALKAAGCEVIRAEKASGSHRDGRTELQVLLDFVRSGDTLVVTRIDRLARSMKDLQAIVHELKGKGVALRATEQPINTATAAGKHSSGCWGCSPSSRPTSGASASWMASLRPRPAGSTRAAGHTSIRPLCDNCASRRGLAPARSRNASISGVPASIACLARQRNRHADPS
jgi:hypothetical protein